MRVPGGVMQNGNADDRRFTKYLKRRQASRESRHKSPGSASSLANGSLYGSTDDLLDGDNINVVVRVRPLNAKEAKSGDESILQFPGDGGIWVDEQKTDKLKPFTFNVVFEPEATQADVLEHSGIQRLIDMAIDGFSCTAFCYGQTGSGKTHTLTGPPDLEKILTSPKKNWEKVHFGLNDDSFAKQGGNPLHKDHGLVFRSFIYLFDELAKRQDATYVIKASYLEIYNEKVIDLLNPGPKRSNLAVRWNKRSRAFVVDNLFSIECSELDDLLAVLEEGLKNRAIGTHNMNEHSSRSHTILTVHIHSEEKASSDDNKGVYITRHGKINFVDLAGSEMTKKTKSEGKTLEEANNINKSLMVLGYCIAQLSSQKKNEKGVHIPYRDSKLTKLLADSLAGNGVTLMIACVSPAKSNLSETSNTLRYAARAKKIKTKPVVVMDPREALIVSLKRELAILHQENNHLRQLLELADSDSGISTGIGFTPDGGPLIGHNAAAAMQAMSNQGGPFGGQPLDGRESSASYGSVYFRGETLSDTEDEINSRPPSQRSRETLRQVSSLLFIATPATSKKIDKSRLDELDSSTLVDLIKDYMSENQELRRENQDLFSVRDMLLRDQELVCKENERLLKKLEDVNSVCCRSPIIPARPAYSAELMSLSYNGSLPRSAGMGSAPDLHRDSRASPVTNIWTNPLTTDSQQHYYVNNGTKYSAASDDEHVHPKSLTPSRSSGSLNGGTPTHGNRPPYRLPPNIDKELEKRKIGSSMNNLSDYKSSQRRSGKNGSAESEGSHDELFTVSNRRKPGHLKDNLAEKKSNSADNAKKKGAIRKERAKKLRENSKSKERS